ncbi:MAG: hypothetical protein LBH64_03855, partial [Coriobacteriales bacterium]|nr:hypothetical protein [Coriobacteriales bacterium]
GLAPSATSATSASESLTPLAATSLKVTGKGKKKSRSVALTKGVWAITYVYTRNADRYGGTNFIAHLDGKKLSYKRLVINDIAKSGKGRENVVIDTTGRYWIDVSYATSVANWSMVFTKLGATKAKRFTGTGATDTKRFKLLAGKTYTFAVKYSGNRDKYGSNYLGVALSGEKFFNRALVNESKAARTVVKKVKVTRTGYYWIDITSALPTVKWTVSYK